jgi:DNA polymerase-3 subunit epsilon
LITDNGRNKEEYSAIYVQKGKFVGMGYVPKEINKNDIDEVILYLKKYKENFFMMNQIVAFALENEDKVLLFEETSGSR